MLNSFPKSLNVIASDSLYISISNNRCRVLSNHTVTVTRRCPLRQESAFLISIHQTFLHLLVHGRIHQVQEWEQTTESIPKTGISKHISRENFSVIRTIVHNLTILIYFIETTREKQCAIQIRIESTQIINVIVVYFQLCQFTIPHIASIGYHIIKCLPCQFVQIEFSLFITDKRRSYFYMNYLASTGIKTYNSTGMLSRFLFLIWMDITATCSRNECKRFIKLKDKIVLEIFRYASRISC